MGEWLIQSMRFLGLSLQQRSLRNYVHSMSPFHSKVLLEMQAFIEKRTGKHWMDAMANAHATEYMTYGAYARHINELKLHVFVSPSLCVYYWWPNQMESLDVDLEERLSQSRGKAVVVQSKYGRPVASYRALFEKVWASRSTMQFRC